MRTVIKLSFLISLAFILTSCAKIFYSSDARYLAGTHQSIAILPPAVSIAANKKIDAQAMMEQQRTESINFQKEMYAWLLKRKMQGRMSPEIQDIETTNAKLLRAGYPENPMTAYEMCELLGVQGIMGSNYSLSKPMSEGAAIAVGLLLGSWGATNEVGVVLNIKDCSNKKLIWNYEHKFSGGVGSSPGRLVDGLMRHASKKMPYFR